jgi:hypothetical protein
MGFFALRKLHLPALRYVEAGCDGPLSDHAVTSLRSFAENVASGDLRIGVLAKGGS